MVTENEDILGICQDLQDGTKLQSFECHDYEPEAMQYS
jgi:hypothetical protein